MRILDRYIARSFITAFGVTLLILTFVMCAGLIFKVTDLLARGASAGLILKIFVCGVPSALSFAAPVSLLTSALLVFGRMSADSEISAMKSGGVSIWQIVATPLLIAAAISLACLYLNWELAPLSRYVQRVAIKMLGVEASLDLIEEGRFLRDFEGLTIYVGRKEGERIYDIIVYDLRGGGSRREIRAKWGIARISPDHRSFQVDLRDVRVDPFYEDRPGPGYCKSWPVEIPIDIERLRKVSRREGDFTVRELVARIRDTAAYYPELRAEDRVAQHSALVTELNKRTVMALSCFTFVLLGSPLGIRTHRRESSIGLAISLLVVLVFYVFMIVGDTLSERPEFRPYLFMWFPIVLATVLGLYLIRRAE